MGVLCSTSCCSCVTDLPHGGGIHPPGYCTASLCCCWAADAIAHPSKGHGGVNWLEWRWWWGYWVLRENRGIPHWGLLRRALCEVGVGPGSAVSHSPYILAVCSWVAQVLWQDFALWCGLTCTSYFLTANRAIRAPLPLRCTPSPRPGWVPLLQAGASWPYGWGGKQDQESNTRRRQRLAGPDPVCNAVDFSVLQGNGWEWAITTTPPPPPSPPGSRQWAQEQRHLEGQERSSSKLLSLPEILRLQSRHRGSAGEFYCRSMFECIQVREWLGKW